MKKVIDIFLIILIFFVFYFLQSNFFTWFNIAKVMPNLFVILVMLIGLSMKKKYGFIFGIIFGLLLDFFIGDRIGINAIALAIVGLTAEILDKNFSKDNRLTIIFMTGILTLICEITIYVLEIIFGNVSMQVLSFIKIVLIEILYNVILITIIYPVFNSFGNKIESDFSNSKSFLKF